MAKSLRQILGEIVSKDRIFDSELMREIYARDASYFNVLPECVVRPQNADEVSKILAVARATGKSVTFRAGGTSLSGQTVGPGIICELRTNWTAYEVRDNGKKIWFEPGLTAEQVNNILRPHHHHIGPDPASASSAMMGGILSNNSSGMEAGVKHNSYHTLSSIEFMLANGHRYNTKHLEDRRRFKDTERELCDELLAIRKEIMESPAMREKIVRKYEIKNVTGYSMNAFVDYEDPVDIFSHAIIGSEGTLAFIISGELNTNHLYSTYSSSMLYFPDVTTAASHAAWLGESGALAVEMMDYDSLRSSQALKSDMPIGTTALLIDYGADSSEELADKIAALEPKIRALKNLSRIDSFTRTVDERAYLWKIRSGAFPCVAGARVPGSTVILEDVAAHVENLADLVAGVDETFKKHGYHGVIFGHARDGNIHPLVTPDIRCKKDLDVFKNFIEDFVDVVLKLNGSLKGEHGTGRAMAPFVAKEWGDDIYTLMCRLKKAADPQGILNPGVIINPDPEAFIKPMKSLDLFGEELGYKEADKCMECGYCEHVCPSRDVTLTPRQRLQARRIIKRTGSEKLRLQYRYMGEETCCADGTCQLPCPMNINTAVVTDAVRQREDSSMYKNLVSKSANDYGMAENIIRGVLKTAVATEKVVSPYPLIWATDFLRKIYHYVPRWSKHFPMPSKLHFNEVNDPDIIYFPSCVTRIFGGSSLGKDDLISVMLRVAEKAGIKMWVPKESHGLCCSQIWEHKGDPEGQAIIANKSIEEFYRLSDNGRIPIVCDTTSCTHSLLALSSSKILSEEKIKKYHELKIIDITRWLLSEVIPHLKITKKKKNVLLHPTCASRITGLDKVMAQIAEKCSDKYLIPDNCYCCGAAGDRGFIFPNVAESATKPEKECVAGMEFDGCYSLARTCEISMNDTIGRPYESIVYLVDETTD